MQQPLLLYAAKSGFRFIPRLIELINFSSQSASLHPSFIFDIFTYKKSKNEKYSEHYFYLHPHFIFTK